MSQKEFLLSKATAKEFVKLGGVGGGGRQVCHAGACPPWIGLLAYYGIDERLCVGDAVHRSDRPVHDAEVLVDDFDWRCDAICRA